MKKSMLIFYGLACLFFLISKFTFESGQQAPLFDDPPGRTSITFLMGEDKTDIPFFEKAELHFSLHPEEGTDLIVKSLRSFEAVIKYLNDYGTPGVSWGTINIVLHGNPNTGLRTLITDGGHVATPKRLIQAFLLESTPRFNNGTIDSMTQLNIWGCGIGKNPVVKIALQQLLQTENGVKPKLYCSPHFVIFKEKDDRRIPVRLNLSYYPYYFKRGYQPSHSEIRHAMMNQYPDAEINWDVALAETSENEEFFHHSYHIPVSYLKIFKQKSDRPELSSQKQKIEWVKAQKELMYQIADSGIPFEKFHWRVHKIIHTDTEGNVVPAVKAIGMSTVMCFLKEVS